MRAAIFKGPGRPLVIEDVPEPKPGPHQVVLRVGRCGICGTDVSMTSGHGFNYPCGAALGHEFAGEVVALGTAIERLAVGDTIAAMPMSGCGHCDACRAGRPLACSSGVSMLMGGFGDYTLADERFAIRLPATLSLADGALVEPLASSLRGVRMGGIGPGRSVLVLGTGAVGNGAIYWARQLGAGRIVGSARSGHRAALAAHMGADAFLTSDALDEGLTDALSGAPDTVIECSGAPGMIAKAIDLVRPGGTVVTIGICSTADMFMPATAVAKEVTMRFSSAYDLDAFSDTVRALDSGAVAPRAMVEETVPLEAVPALLEAMRDGTSHATKILVDPAATA